jgi:RNA ligase (TIGR02306 family)
MLTEILMTDWNCQVVKIEKVVNHPYADQLDVATVLNDYPVIVKRGEYKVGDLAAYLCIDTIVPDTEQFYFLCPKAYEKYEENGEVKQRQVGSKYMLGQVPEKYRIIKAKKIRNVYSQGMLVPVPIMISYNIEAQTSRDVPVALGESVEIALWLKKWEEPEEDNIPNAKRTRGGNAEKAPQDWAIPHYDIDGLRKYLACLLPDEDVVLTEKLHGSNAAFCHDGNKLWVKSRNFYKRMDSDDPWWDIAIRYGLEEKLVKFPMKVFFGEMYGQVKGFRYDCEIIDGAMHSKIRFFDVWDAKEMRYLDYDPFVAAVTEAGLPLVPELYRGTWKGKEDMYPYAEGLTTLGGKHIREGFVLRTIKERYEPRLNSRMQVKLVGEGYNLQK